MKNLFSKTNNLWKEDKREIYRKSLLLFLSINVISLSFSIFVSSVAFVISIFCFVSILVIDKKWNRTSIDYLFLLFILAETVSTIFSVNTEQSFVNMKRLFIFSIFYMTFYAFNSNSEIKKFFMFLLVVVGMISLIEIFVKYSFELHIGRIGVFQHYMTTGGLKMIFCLYALPQIFNKTLSKKERTVVTVFFCLTFITLLLTMTRSAWLGFILGAVICGIMNKKVLFYIIGFVVLIFLIAPDSIKERGLSSFSTTHTSNVTRFHMIETGFKIFQDYPVFGIGDIDVKKTYIQYTVPLEPHEGGHLHNNFMQILVCLGAFGFIIFILLFVFLFVLLIKNYNFVKNDDNLKILALIPIMVFFAFHFSGLFEWNFGDQEIAILFWFSMGLSMLSKKLFLNSTENYNKHII